MADESNLQVTVYARFAKGDEVYVVGLEALGGPTNDPDLVAGNPDTDLYDEDDTGDLTATLHIPKSLFEFAFGRQPVIAPPEEESDFDGDSIDGVYLLDMKRCLPMCSKVIDLQLLFDMIEAPVLPQNRCCRPDEHGEKHDNFVRCHQATGQWATAGNCLSEILQHQYETRSIEDSLGITKVLDDKDWDHPQADTTA